MVIDCASLIDQGRAEAEEDRRILEIIDGLLNAVSSDDRD